MSAKWPVSVATDADLSVAVNSLQTTLSGNIDNAVATIGLASTTGYPAAGYVTIDNEVVQYTGVSGGNLTGCVRGADGTSAASHNSGVPVSACITAAHHNSLKDEIKAIETFLDTVLGKATTVTASVFNYLVGVTSAIQTQLGLLAPKDAPTFTTSVTTPVTANRAVTTGAAGILAASATTDTELGYVHGVTSAIQTQLGTKQATLTAGQLPGTATNDDASAGNVGQYVSSSVSTPTNFPTTGQFGDATSITLPAGDWDVECHGILNSNHAVVTNLIMGIGTAAGTNASGLVQGVTDMDIAQSGTRVGIAIPRYRASVSGSAVFYLKVYAAYAGTVPQYYGMISARRMR